MRRPAVAVPLLSAFLAIVLHPGAAGAVQVTVPAVHATTEGLGGGNCIPFGCGGWGEIRYQQVYSSTEFTGPLEITGIAFRASDESPATAGSSLTNLQISLSTTSRAVGGLSTDLASNVGGDSTVVLTAASAALDPADTGSPRPFDLVFPFTASFVYDPAAGNLLLDVSVDLVSGFLSVDEPSANTVTSRAFSIGIAFGQPSDISGADALALVTQFSGNAVAGVPEPATVWLLATGAWGVVWVRRRRAVRHQ